jgi:predicted Holliday junction resolvase-like endonuclease
VKVLAFYQEAKRIYGICPCCGELFRLSEATLFTKDPPPRTEFDAVDEARRKLERAIEKFDEKEQALREKALAVGQKAAQKRLRRIARPFVKRKIDPQDVKVLFDPIEFVAFRGMCDGGVKAVSLIDRPAGSKDREKLQESVRRTVDKGNYEWKELRIDTEGRVAET